MFSQVDSLAELLSPLSGVLIISQTLGNFKIVFGLSLVTYRTHSNRLTRSSPKVTYGISGDIVMFAD